jgi:hypothetical protein
MRTGILALVAIATVLAAATSAEAAPPKLLAHDPGAGSDFVVRPQTVVLSRDATGIFGRLPAGIQRRGRGRRYVGSNRGHLYWRWWTPSEAMRLGDGRQIGAYGLGTYWVDACDPDCAHGTYYPLTAALTAWRVRDGHYTRIQQQAAVQGQDFYAISRLAPDGPGYFTWMWASGGLDTTGCGGLPTAYCPRQ